MWIDCEPSPRGAHRHQPLPCVQSGRQREKAIQGPALWVALSHRPRTPTSALLRLRSPDALPCPSPALTNAQLDPSAARGACSLPRDSELAGAQLLCPQTLLPRTCLFLIQHTAGWATGGPLGVPATLGGVGEVMRHEVPLLTEPLPAKVELEAGGRFQSSLLVGLQARAGS